MIRTKPDGGRASDTLMSVSETTSGKSDPGGSGNDDRPGRKQLSTEGFTEW